MPDQRGVGDVRPGLRLRHEGGLIGHGEERGGRLRAIEFDRIKGGKEFDPSTPWFADLLGAIGQPA